MTPEAYYQQQLQEKSLQYQAIKKSASTYSLLRVLLALTLAVVLYFTIMQNETWLWVCLFAGVLGFFYMIKLHGAYKEQEIRLAINIELLNAELKALENNHSSFLSGKEFIDSNHPYSYDLDVFGKGSVYQMLCRAVTKDGEQKLASFLQAPYSDINEIEIRQQKIKELTGKPEFLQSFRVAGTRFEEGKGDKAKVLEWLHATDRFLPKKYLFVFAVLIPLLSIAFLLLSVQQGIFHPALLYILAANWILLMIHSKDIKHTHVMVGRSVKLIDKYEHLLRIVSATTFTTPALSDVSNVSATSVKQITELRKLAHLFDSRQNGMVGPLMNSFFLFDIYCVLRLEMWRKKNRNGLDMALENISDTDVYVSLATYAFNNPDSIYPDIKTDLKSIIAKDIKHPLLSKKHAVGNNVEIGSDEKLYLLTGANMTGKSTFIRTLGVNVILAYMGVPVRAAAMQLPLLHLFTAIRISDSVQDDISYFKAELNRMQQLMQAVQHSNLPSFVLLDEPLRGTNSTDKQMGTESIMKKLLQYNAIGIVATHDTILCKLEEIYSGDVSNYHFESMVTDDGLKFDFRLKKGCSTSNNATILMKQMGIV